MAHPPHIPYQQHQCRFVVHLPRAIFFQDQSQRCFEHQPINRHLHQINYLSHLHQIYYLSHLARRHQYLLQTFLQCYLQKHRLIHYRSLRTTYH